MHIRRHWFLPVTIAALTACEAPPPTSPLDVEPLLGKGPTEVIATGGGKFDVTAVGSIGQFGFSAVGHADGSASGHLRFQISFGGFDVDFQGKVTCVSIDRAEGRAWIGGVVTQNRSDHPSFTTPRTQVGRDIWFRVLDNGSGANAEPDRTTFVGFEGDRDIITSQEYCDVQPWVEGNVATWAVVNGNISAR